MEGTMKENRKLSIAFAFLTLSFILFSHRVDSAEPPSDPILRIESGMHTARINRIGTDSENRYLVTASEDKTVRVWEPLTGRLIRILRPPLGDGDEGKIYSVAISPDGNTVAAGGWTEAGESSHNIYLFDRSSGKLIKRITGLPNVIPHLAYSRDGRYLVACLGENNGIRLYRTSDYSLIGEDKDYGDTSYGADFDRHGRLVTTSLDGYIRLYSIEGGASLSLKLMAKEKGRGGSRPFSVSFSPSSTIDDVRIAVGYYDSTKVDVFSGKDLSYLYSPDTTGVDNGNISQVTWSSDGRFLYAGGRYNKGGQFPILKWTDQGKGRYKELNGAHNAIIHLLPLKDGGIAFGAGDPAFGIINANDERLVFKTPYIADYRDMLQNFLVSHDGFTIQFGYEQWGKSPAVFSVKDRALTPESALSFKPSSLNLKPPVTEYPGLKITDWKYTYTPKLNGKALTLKPYETSRSLTLSPSGESFLLGTEWHLRLFDANGNERWNMPVPGPAWSVNISGNGRVAVAAFGDGTIRWYRMTDGKELLTFFPHNDKKRWVLWTPSGYYAASTGAEDLIGWHLNNGKDAAADFYPVSRFRERFNRPDVIAKLIETGDEQEAVRLANEESGRRQQETRITQLLPPIVTIVSPAYGQQITHPEITLKYIVRTPSGEPVTRVRALIDGRPVSTERGIMITGKESDVRELRVTMPERDAEVSLIAENRYAASDPATVRLKWAGKPVRDEFVAKPKLYVLAIGVSKYQDKDLILDYAAKDAEDFANIMLQQKGVLYRDVVLKVLTDDKASRDEIMDGLDWIRKETTSKDIAMVFLAGHGVNDPSGIYYYLPSNANTEKLMRTGVAFSDIRNTVASLAGKTVLFVDTCHSGNVMGKRRGVADIDSIVNELASAENGAVVFASSTGKQYALEDKTWGNGAFTKALVEGISGKADYTGKGKITVNMLDLYLSERVKELTKGKQTPTTTKPQTIPDFPIAMKN